MRVSRISLIQGLADLSLNISSGYLAVLIITPTFFGLPFRSAVELLTGNLIPAIFTYVFGCFMLDKSK